jgi:hypothetical protein
MNNVTDFALDERIFVARGLRSDENRGYSRSRRFKHNPDKLPPRFLDSAASLIFRKHFMTV